MRVNLNGETEACESFRRTLRARLIGECDEFDWSVAEKHLEDCRSCQAYATEMRSAVEALAALQEVSIEPGLSFRRRWKTAVTRESRSLHRPALWSILAGLLRNNWRPSLGLAAVWILIIWFNLNAPKPTQLEIGHSGWTPGKVVQFFSAEREVLAKSHQWKLSKAFQP